MRSAICVGHLVAAAVPARVRWFGLGDEGLRERLWERPWERPRPLHVVARTDALARRRAGLARLESE